MDYLESCKINHSGNSISVWDPIDEIEVEFMIEMLDVSKDSNTKRINAFLLKECLLCSINEITHLFNDDSFQ